MMMAGAARASARHAAVVGIGLTCAAFLVRPTAGADFSSGGAFLQLGHGARLHGLGSAGVAMLRDDAAAYWNPANLAWLQRQNGVTLMHADILDQIDDGYDSFSFARAAGERLGEASQPLRPSRFGYGLFLSHLGFTFASGRDWSENVFQFAAAMAVNNYASVGMAIKGLQANNDFDNADGEGIGLDLGLTVLVFDRLTAVIVGRDVWTRVHWDTGRWETSEPVVTAGFELRPAQRWNVETDLSLRQGGLHTAAGGVECQVYRDLFWLRGGATFVVPGESRLYPSAGVGVRYSRFVLDYGAAFDEEESLGIGQRVSLRVGF